LARKLGLTESERREYLNELIDKRSIKDATVGEAQQAIKAISERLAPHLTVERTLFTAEIRSLKRASKTKKGYDKTLGYLSNLMQEFGMEKMPEDKVFRKDFMRHLYNFAKAQPKISKKIAKADSRSGEVNFMHWFSSARYTWGQYEQVSGTVLRPLFNRMVGDVNEAKIQAMRIIEEAYKVIGEDPAKFRISFEDNKLMAMSLFESSEDKRQEARNKLSNDKLRALRDQLEEILKPDGEVATDVRTVRFYLWFRKGIMPPDIKQMDKEKSEAILQEGIEAMRQGRLRDWIETQTWGTREFYYMSQYQGDNLTDTLVTSLMPKDLLAKADWRDKPQNIPGEVKTRQGKGIIKPGAVVANIGNHITRVKTALLITEDLEKFWNNFIKANPSAKDIRYARAYVDTLVGRPKESGPMLDVGIKARRIFWKFHFYNPTKAFWFAFRNIHQNIYGASQLDVVEAAKAVKDIAVEKLTRKTNEQRNQHFDEDWKTKISQKGVMWHQFMLMEDVSSAPFAPFMSTYKKLDTTLSKVEHLMNGLGHLAIMSDELNRLGIWPVAHRIAQKNVEDYLAGEIDYKKLKKRLKLSTLELSERLELGALLAAKDTDTFIRKYAEFKTENTHFRYESSLRSAAEQYPLARLLTGLMVYPRGVYQILKYNGVLPMLDAAKTGDVRQGYEGFKNILALFFMSWIAKRWIKKITGKDAYGVIETMLSYTPLDPGFGKIKETFDNVSEIHYRGAQQGWSIEKTAGLMLRELAWIAEFIWFPLEMFTKFYEATNDVYGVRLWSLLARKYSEKYKDKKYKQYQRSSWKAFIHALLGGFEMPTKEEREQQKKKKRRIIL